ncbi:NAD(P)/FAD-dependent oxidoreductase [Autumnicola musiva]|uniref:FAD-dependent oxidoreductase n=1 Tax=Autumnicola musiva TaxID=3075589 RepID=A0ABU3D4A2_9FLAO|nr:FAD-dependent oxidoreductase [Zunongwangia sp. F117]MDT0676361.1 FAD-dependent oxidoreductase [Zunongwangia sp. F117]
MNFSYWETKTWFSNIDYTIIGGGITGLNCAWYLKQKYPKAKIVVLEQGLLPNGSSTKSGGFACFGSLSEILEDLKSNREEEVVELTKQRVNGLKLLRENLGDKAIGFKSYGGFELFPEEDGEFFDYCLNKMDGVNRILKPIFREQAFSLEKNRFGFRNVQHELVYNCLEAQLDMSKMMATLLQKVQISGVKILNNVTVKEYSEEADSVEIRTEEFSFKTNKLFIATNGLASKLGITAVKPAREQVLITKPIGNLKIKGIFQIDKGFYYFRNIDDRILIGGGRNLDFKTEETTEFTETELIQNKLNEKLKTIVLPKTEFEIDQRWSGIVGMGESKKPVVKQISNNVYCGVRLDGMGIATGSLTGKELAELL